MKEIFVKCVLILSLVLTIFACSSDNNYENQKIIVHERFLPDRDNSRFDSIYNANSFSDLKPYLDSNDIWEFRAAISRLGNLVSQESEPKELLYDAWNKEGEFNKFNREYLSSDLVRGNIAYYLLLSGENNQDLIDYLYSLKNHRDYVVRHDLALAFGDVGGKEATDLLKEFAKSSDKNLARAAINSLDTRRKILRDQYADEVLKELLKDKNVVDI